MGHAANIAENAFLSLGKDKNVGEDDYFCRAWTEGIVGKKIRGSNSGKETIFPHKASLLERLLRERNTRVETKWNKMPMIVGKPFLCRYGSRYSSEIDQR